MSLPPSDPAPDSRTGQSRWLRCFHPAPQAAARLVCFPHAGGAAGSYFSMSAALAPDVEVLGVQYPGRQDRRDEPCAEDLGELADRVEAALAARLAADDRQSEGEPVPTAFFGHSMGALLAFEVALRRERRGAPGPAVLFASGRRAPGSAREEIGRVQRGGDEALIADMRLLGGTDPQVFEIPELLELTLPVVRGDYLAVERYRCEPGAEITAPVTVLVGDEDPRAPVEEARDWRHHTSGDFALRTFPGGHFYLHKQQAEVVGVLREALGVGS